MSEGQGGKKQSRRRFIKWGFYAIGLAGVSGAAYYLGSSREPPGKIETTITTTATLTEKARRFEFKKLGPVLREAARGLDEANCFCEQLDCVEFPQIIGSYSLFEDKLKATKLAEQVLDSFDVFVNNINGGILKIEPVQPTIESVQKSVEELAKGGLPDESLLFVDKYDFGGKGTLFFDGKVLAESLLGRDDFEKTQDAFEATDGVAKYATKALLPKMVSDLERLKEQAEIFLENRAIYSGKGLWDIPGWDGFWGRLRALSYRSTVEEEACQICPTELCYCSSELSDCAQLSNLIIPSEASIDYFTEKVDLPSDVPKELRRIVLGKAAVRLNEIAGKIKEKDKFVESIGQMLKGDPAKAVDLAYVLGCIDVKNQNAEKIKETIASDLQDLFDRGRYHSADQFIRVASPTLWPFHVTNINERIHPATKLVTPDLSLPQMEIMKKATDLVNENFEYSVSVPTAVESFEMAEKYGKGGKPVGDGTFRAGVLYYVGSKAGVECYVAKFYGPKHPILILEAVLDGKSYAFGSKVNGLDFDKFLEKSGKELYDTRQELGRLPRQHFDLNLAGMKVVKQYNV